VRNNTRAAANGGASSPAVQDNVTSEYRKQKLLAFQFRALSAKMGLDHTAGLLSYQHVLKIFCLSLHPILYCLSFVTLHCMAFTEANLFGGDSCCY
jgi:hypothetical protein